MQEKTVELLEKVASILKVVVGVRVFANRKGSVPGIYTHSCYLNTIENLSNACVNDGIKGLCHRRQVRNGQSGLLALIAIHFDD